MLQDHSPSIRLYTISRFYGREIELFQFNNRRQDDYMYNQPISPRMIKLQVRMDRLINLDYHKFRPNYQ